MRKQDNERIEALKRMLAEKDTEAKSLDELEQALEQELSKDPELMDTDYVDEITMAMLEMRHPHAAGSASSASARRHKSKRKKRFSGFKPAVAMVLCLTLVVSTAGLADAFGWWDLKKMITPLLEQLGFITNLNPDEELNDVLGKSDGFSNTAEGSWDEGVDTVIQEESQLPQFIHSYPVQPPYLPDGYVFTRAEVYADSSMENIVMTYAKQEEELYIRIRRYSGNIGGEVLLAEKQPVEQELERIDMLSDEGVNSAVMEVENGHYMVWGKQDLETIADIMKAYEGVIFP